MAARLRGPFRRDDNAAHEPREAGHYCPRCLSRMEWSTRVYSAGCWSCPECSRRRAHELLRQGDDPDFLRSMGYDLDGLDLEAFDFDRL